MEVHAAGGGIHFTVDRTRCGSVWTDTLSSYSAPCDLLVTRAATEAELVELLVARLRRMLRAGTTTVECKVELVTVFLQTF